jgi:hypothetical protein
MMDDKHGPPIRKRSATADYPRPQPHNMMRERAPSAKLANKSLVTKINDKPSNPIPDVVPPHETQTSSEVTNGKSYTKMENGDKVSEMANGVRAGKYEIPSSKVDHTVAKVEERCEASTSKINNPSSKLDGLGTVEDVKVQVQRPTTGVSLISNESTSSRFTDDVDLITNLESNFVDPKGRIKRKSSMSRSEKEALGILDEVIRVFDDVDDNLDEANPSESKTIGVKPDTSDFDPSYETMANIKESLMDRDDVKPNGVHDSSNSNYNLTTSTLQQKHVGNELVPPTPPELVYAKPDKRGNNTTSTINPGELTTPRSTAQVAPEKSPVVPPKRFVVEADNHEIKFSPLRKASPSASLSKSLNNSIWANANEIPSPKRKPVQDNNDNFSLKRGQLSGPVPINIDDNYVEPPPDYDTNTTLSSIAKSTTDDSFNRDTWGSMTSSSTSGSRKVKKEFRPEVLKMIDKRKTEKEEQKEIEGRKFDGLVNRSFRMREASLKETASKSAVKEDTAKESEIESDYTSINNEADLWLQGYERMRASSEGKKELALKSRSNKTTNVPIHNQNEETSIIKVENGLPSDTILPLSETTQAVLNQTRASDDLKIANNSLSTVATTSKVRQTTKVKKEKAKAKSHLAKNEENDSSDDEDLIRLMETGVSAENSTDSSLPKPERFGYVPRALRMSFGQSWEGIRKDRREWKSKEMKQATAQSPRKGGKKLSNRFDHQEARVEMLF